VKRARRDDTSGDVAVMVDAMRAACSEWYVLELTWGEMVVKHGPFVTKAAARTRATALMAAKTPLLCTGVFSSEIRTAAFRVIGVCGSVPADSV